MFDGKKRIEVTLGSETDDAASQIWTMASLIEELRLRHLREKEEMFVMGGSVRPGIIVLVNDTDWELLDTTRYRLAAGDSVAFISTLHGG